MEPITCAIIGGLIAFGHWYNAKTKGNLKNGRSKRKLREEPARTHNDVLEKNNLQGRHVRIRSDWLNVWSNIARGMQSPPKFFASQSHCLARRMR